LDGDVAIAAFAASQLNGEEAKKVVATFGVSTDLIPAPPFFGTNELALKLALLVDDQSQAEVAATVIFCLCSAAAKSNVQSQLSRLRGIAAEAILDSPHKSLLGILESELEKLPAPKASVPSYEGGIISISIDLVGSTAAKRRAMKVAKDDGATINRVNEAIYREFCRIEKLFYSSCVSRNGASKPIDLMRFFTVKGIGDEIWILCTTNESDVPEVGYRLIDAALSIANQCVSFFATENEEGPHFDRDFDYGLIEHVKSPIKVFMDYIVHASSIGMLRDQILTPSIPVLLKDYLGREATPIEVAMATRRLCLSSFEPFGWSAIRECRTDFIGHEIDRFFRTTKAARPGTVTIGKALVDAMRLSFSPEQQEIVGVLINSDTAFGGTEKLRAAMPCDPIYAHTKKFLPNELKGIDYEYDTYTLFAPRSLKGLYVMMDADAKNGFTVAPYEATRDKIDDAIVDKLVSEIIANQNKAVY
jgi:hypothetical protein